MDANIEKPKNQMLKPAMNYGLLFGAVLIAFSVMTWAFNLTMEKYISYSVYLVMIVCMFLFTRKYRDEYAGGFITYGKALKFSALTLLFVTFINGFYAFIFYKFIDPGMVEVILERTRDTMLEKNSELTEEQIDMAISWQRKFMSPLMMFVSSVIGLYFIGIIIALITSIFVRKKDNNPDSGISQPL